MLRVGGRWFRVAAIGGVVGLVVFSFFCGVAVGVYRWPPFSLLKWMQAAGRDARSADAEIPEAAAPIAVLLQGRAGPSKSDQARLARQFVFANSVHRIDDEHARYAWDTPTVLRMLLDYSQTREHPPHLSCGPRALALQAILDALALENRVVHIYSGDYEEVRSHTFVEVRDERSGGWVIHDPGYDVTYVDAQTHQQVSLLRLVLGDRQSVLPASQRGRGWEVNGVEHLKLHYFQAAKYDGPAGASDLLVVNTDRLSVAKRFSANDDMTFVEFAEKWYRRPVFLLDNTILNDRADPRGRIGPEQRGAGG